MELAADRPRPNRTWAEINLDNIAHNYKEFVRLAGRGKTLVMSVIKANGYGHGSVALAKRLEAEGCAFFGVAALDEAVELRRAGITARILVLNHVSKERLGEALENDITLTVFSKDMAESISQAAQGKAAKIHIKIDTGMTRVGFNPDEAVCASEYISRLPNIDIEGVFTHFSSADEADRSYTLKQLVVFNEVTDGIKNSGVSIKIKHAANSAAAIMYPEARFDMVRIGISLYGCYPSEDVDKSIVGLKPCMELKTQIIRINAVSENVSVSYGRIFTTKRESRLATIPIGYADGISRVLAGKLKILVNGQEAPVVGKICMDQCVVDITDITGQVNELDEVVVFGWQGRGFIPVERVAGQMGTINYEILCAVSRRVPRYYYENGKPVAAENYLLK